MKATKVRQNSSQGFALILALSLMAFLVLLLLSLTTLSRIETSAAHTNENLALARQNALLALNIALGELQKHAGPDQRVTARSDIRGTDVENPYWTMVWNTADPNQLPIFLVSGNERFNPAEESEYPDGYLTEKTEIKEPDPSDPKNTSVWLLQRALEKRSWKPGDPATNGDKWIKVPKQPIESDKITGLTGSQTVGHYAYWVADEGVKTPVATQDRTDNVTYASFNEEARERLKQQMAVQPTLVGFDSKANNSLLDKVFTFDQLKILTSLETDVTKNFHNWSVDNFSVLANTRSDKYRGLMKDLSLSPSLLGSAFEAYMDYAKVDSTGYIGYMEDPTAPSSVYPPEPPYPSGIGIDPANSMRRRYKITPPTTDNDITFSVAPVISEFHIQFGIERKNAATIIKARACVELWNPYTSALIPEELSLEVTGLPSFDIIEKDGVTESVLKKIELDDPALFGRPMTIKLPFPVVINPDPDRTSWLPGRVYNWITDSPSPFQMKFYSKDWTVAGWTKVVALSLPTQASGKTYEARQPPETTNQLTLELKNSADNLLATYKSPIFNRIDKADIASLRGQWAFGFPMRLEETSLTPKWLEKSAGDPRNPSLLITQSWSPGPDPNLYDENFSELAINDFLLNRQQAPGGIHYNEDVPVFELPRQPSISVGALQHLQVHNERPFAIGNPWGSAGSWNNLFDRFFLSGTPLSGSFPDLSTAEPLSNFHLKTTDLAVTVEDLRSEGDLSSKFLMVRGSFNLNSVSRGAWISMLKSIRFPGPDEDNSWKYVNKNDPKVNPSGPDSKGTVIPSDPAKFITFPDAVFFRFSQSAQETYKAEEGFSAGSAIVATPPNTHLYRRGARELSTDQVEDFVDKIIERLREKFKTGPFESLEEFLDSGLLENAIADAGLNPESTIPEFSSQFLTQADIMTALAPTLFNRSDTFLIRAYGEVINPFTKRSEGQAMCEARVQRIPTPVDPDDQSDNGRFAQPLGVLGRQFQILSFRWLDFSDI